MIAEPYDQDGDLELWTSELDDGARLAWLALEIEIAKEEHDG